jgi:hypothetical protein
VPKQNKRSVPVPTAGNAERHKLGDTLFAVVHMLALIAVFLYGLVALIRGNTLRFAVVMGGLLLYYALVLHKPVTREIARKRAARSRP